MALDLMTRLKFSVLLILVASALLLNGASVNTPSSVEPVQKKEKSLSEEQNTKGSQKRDGTQSAPIPKLDKPSAPISNQKTGADEESAKQCVPIITDWIMVGVTTAYAVFALFQWLAIRRQAIIAAAGVEVARASAKAAEESAKAVDAQLHVYRPFIVVRKPTVDSMQIQNLHRRKPVRVDIKIRNYGIGPADIVKYFVSGDVFDWMGTIHRRLFIMRVKPVSLLTP